MTARERGDGVGGRALRIEQAQISLGQETRATGRGRPGMIVDEHRPLRVGADIHLPELHRAPDQGPAAEDRIGDIETVDLDGAPARAADEVVVMLAPGTPAEQVLAVGCPQDVDVVALGERLERPVDGCETDALAALTERDPADCLRELLALPVRAENVTLKRPSLNDVFLQLTGRNLRE